jgi:hypothetical protein
MRSLLGEEEVNAGGTTAWMRLRNKLAGRGNCMNFVELLSGNFIKR